MSKKSYMSLLKEAIAEFDTSDTVEVKGPMLDPILSWDGDGELPIFKDAASILERYYFNEDQEKTIKTLDEADYENDDGKPDKGPAMKNAKGAGTTQAGTSDSGMDKHEEEIAKEAEEVEEKEFSGKEVPKEKEYTDEGLEMENAIIEKLIAEMEDDEDDDDDDEDEKEENVDEMEMTYTGDEPKVSMPKEKKAKSPEEDTQGAGTQQAGTGPDEGQIPPRKDKHDSFVKPKKYTDENTQIEEALAALEAEMADDEDEVADDEAEKDLNVDKELAKEAAGQGAVPPPSMQKKMKDEDQGDDDAYSEAFSIFKEAIREEDEEDADSDEDEMEESWQAAIDADVAAVVENDAITVEMLSLSEAMTSREKDFVWGKINRMFGDCANKCGRLAVSSQARACKDSCIAKKDQAIKAARAKAKSQKMQQKANVAKAKGKDVKADRYAQKSAAAGAKAKNIAKY